MTQHANKDEAYATHLQFLWEQYNKLTGLGILTAAATLIFLLQGIVLNKDTREVITSLQTPLNTSWLIFAVFLAGASAIAFIICRWCSQILMERQVYGNRNHAIQYFKNTLEGETILPTALEPKWYFGKNIERVQFLRIIGKLNEYAKYMGILFILCSWVFCFIFAWPLIDSLDSFNKK